MSMVRNLFKPFLTRESLEFSDGFY